MYGTEFDGRDGREHRRRAPHITRQRQDAFALRSHQRAIAAIDSGKFAEEILPVAIPQRKGDPKVVDTDERPRRDTSLESLAKLKPAFRKEGGTVTAGNSSGLNDGAAALLVMSEEKAQDARAETAGAHPCVRGCRGAAAHDGPGSGPGGAESPRTGRVENRRYRPGRIERSLCHPVPGCHRRPGPGPGNRQRQRRGDRPGASAGLLGGAHPDHAAARNAAAGKQSNTAWRPCAWGWARAKPPWSNGWGEPGKRGDPGGAATRPNKAIAGNKPLEPLVYRRPREANAVIRFYRRKSCIPCRNSG